MYMCNHCQNTSDTPVNFCTVCGSRMVEQPQEVQPQQPVYQPESGQNQPVYGQPQYPAAQPAKPHLGKVITGMALGISGGSFGILGMLYTLIGMVEAGMAFGMAIAFSMFSAPLSIVGLVMSAKNIREGSTSGMCRVGKGLGLAGVILSGVMLFFGIMNLGM